MKEKIQELIDHHKTAKMECYNLLEELSQIDTTKLSYQEENALKELKTKNNDELYFRQLFIQDLESLL